MGRIPSAMMKTWKPSAKRSKRATRRKRRGKKIRRWKKLRKI
jgi:hypothetical protein